MFYINDPLACEDHSLKVSFVLFIRDRGFLLISSLVASLFLVKTRTEIKHLHVLCCACSKKKWTQTVFRVVGLQLVWGADSIVESESCSVVSSICRRGTILQAFGLVACLANLLGFLMPLFVVVVLILDQFVYQNRIDLIPKLIFFL